MSKELEIRHFKGIEIRATEEKRQMTGYAAVFNSDSVDFGWFKEQIAPGAFSRSIKEKVNVRALVDHDTGKVIASTKAKTLSVREDDKGLFVDLEPANTTHGNDILELVKRGDVDAMSFGFRVIEDKWETRDGKDFRTLIDVDLMEVSIVAMPAYPATSISARSAEKVWEEHQKQLATGSRASTERVKRMVAFYDRIS